MAEFPASALTYVGNYAGPCYIHLNGEAIVVRYETGTVINKWPYNCIRQFRAEDETGKFSFVSGRRGPYGVAEYNFKLPNDSLSLLQSALTNFTGAQFSSVAPGSGSGGDQQPQPPQQQQPPQYPPRQSYSVSTAYQTTPRYYGGHGSRPESVSSANYSDNVFQSPVHSQQIPVPLPNSTSPQGTSPRAPRLPPRDYSMSGLPGVPSDQNSPYIHSMDESLMRSQSKARSMTGSSTNSSLSNASTDTGYAHSMTPPTLPPRHPSMEHAPETRVAQGTSYNDVDLHHQERESKKFLRANTVDVLRPPPPVPPKKGLDRLKEGGGAPADVSEETMATEQNKREYSRSPEAESSLDSVNMTRSQLGQDRRSSTANKESPYDHLPSEMEALEIAKAAKEESEFEENRPSSISPEQNIPNGKKSPLMDEDLELHRSSPTVKTRSITPENAKKIRKMAEDGVQHRRTLTTSRVSSDGRIKQKQNFDQRKVQTVKARPSKVRAQLEMDDTYQVPRPSNSNGEVGAGDQSSFALESPPNGRRDMTVPYDATDVYSVPRPNNRVVESGSDNIYKVPSNVQAVNHTHQQDIYNVPRSAANNSPPGGIYNTPRKLEDEQGGNYDTPRNAQSTSPPRFARSSSGKENLEHGKDLDEINEELPPMIGRMRPTRSFESLHRKRVNTSVSDVPQRPIGVYMDIDLDRPIHPAKNAPLPPLPQLPGGPIPPTSTAKPISESVYWEISDDMIEKNRSRLRNTTVSTPSISAHEKPRSMSVVSPQGDHYARPRLPEPAFPQYSDINRSSVGGIQLRQGSNRPADVLHAGREMVHSVSATAVLSSKKSRPHSDSDKKGSTDRPDSSVLGTSTPLDDEILSDEYVIVTGADRRPKVNPNPPMPAAMTAPKLDDEYEVMTSARADNIIQRQLQRVQYPTQFPTHHSSQYSTPDPTLYSHPTSNAPSSSASSVPLPHQDYPKEHSSPVQPHSLKIEENMAGGVNLDDMSPCDDQPAYHNVSHNRKSSSPSVSSTQSDGNEETDDIAGAMSVEPAASSSGYVAMVKNTGLVKTMAGSPLNPLESSHLKSQTRSLGNILEENHYQVPPTRSANKSPSTSPPTSPLLKHHASSGHHTPSTGTPTTTKKHHDYVNHMMDDGSRPSTPENKGSPPLKQKRPQPLPRTLQRGESVNAETS